MVESALIDIYAALQNQSLQVIRQKWFSLTGQKTSDTIQLKSFLADLQSFSPELLKNVVNLADDNVRFVLVWICLW